MAKLQIQLFVGEWRESIKRRETYFVDSATQIAVMVATICDWPIGGLFLLVLLRARSTCAFAPAVAGVRMQQAISIRGVPSTLQNFAATSPYEFALLFDCDGVILETEELHRLAYNEAFRKFELSIDGKPVEWSVCISCQPQILRFA